MFFGRCVKSFNNITEIGLFLRFGGWRPFLFGVETRKRVYSHAVEIVAVRALDAGGMSGEAPFPPSTYSNLGPS